MARALIILLCYLAFLAAIGLTAGSLFSLPVASFASFSAMVLLALGGYIRTVAMTGIFYVTHHGEVPELSALDSALLQLYKLTNIAVSPITAFHPLQAVASAEFIPWLTVAKAANFQPD